MSTWKLLNGARLRCTSNLPCEHGLHFSKLTESYSLVFSVKRKTSTLWIGERPKLLDRLELGFATSKFLIKEPRESVRKSGPTF